MRFVLDLAQHPTLSQGYDEYQQNMESFSERREFLKRQFENLGKEIDKRQEEFWLNVIQYAKEQQLIPETYSRDTHCLEFDKKSKQLFMLEKEDQEQHHGSLGAFIATIMKGPPDGQV